MTLNDFIEQKAEQFEREHPNAWLPLFDHFLRSALRECAEKTVEAVKQPGTAWGTPDYNAAGIDMEKRARAWLGSHVHPHD